MSTEKHVVVAIYLNDSCESRENIGIHRDVSIGDTLELVNCFGYVTKYRVLDFPTRFAARVELL